MKSPEPPPLPQTPAGEHIAILSCIHGNMAALEAVWDDLQARKVDRVICLGDLVGYGPWPREVIDFVQRHNITTVRGCWDEGIGLERSDCGCSCGSKRCLRCSWAQAKSTTRSSPTSVPGNIRASAWTRACAWR
ncbi:MAG: metallophosphoesterase, partial [Verrucomicrobia bacterium]|nr:metallophosphoesterase [Verrucomicrobiota bacterium]